MRYYLGILVLQMLIIDYYNIGVTIYLCYYDKKNNNLNSN